MIVSWATPESPPLLWTLTCSSKKSTERPVLCLSLHTRWGHCPGEYWHFFRLAPTCISNRNLLCVCLWRLALSGRGVWSIVDYTQQVAVQSLESMLYLHFCSGMWFQLLWAVLFGFTYLAVHKSEFTYHNNSLCCCTVFHTISVLMWIRHNRSAVTRGNSTPPLPFYCCTPFTPNVYNV